MLDIFEKNGAEVNYENESVRIPKRLVNNIIDNELFDYLNFIFTRKIEVNNETIDFDEIKRVGIVGNFMDFLKNKKRLKELYRDSDIFVAERYKNSTKAW